MARIAASLACVSFAAAQGTWGKPLRFRADGTFKIVEVSDVHFTRNLRCNDLSASQQKYPCSDANGTAFWRKMIAEEDPDVFLFTGDNVWCVALNTVRWPFCARIAPSSSQPDNPPSFSPTLHPQWRRYFWRGRRH